MTRSQIELPEYFDRYINMCDDISVIEAMETSITEIDENVIAKWKALGSKTYAANKWTINEMLQHIIDTERIFSYRALCFARDEKQRMLSFEEDDYAKNSLANDRSIESIIDELIALHKSTLALYKSFSNEMLMKQGMGFKGLYSVASIGFIIAGHQRWHLKVLEEKYYCLM